MILTRSLQSSIKRKLTLIIMLTSAVAVLLASAALLVFDMVGFREAMKDDLVTLARVTGGNSAAALTFDDQKGAAEVLRALRAKQSVIGAAVYNNSGEVFATYLRPGAVGVLWPQPSQHEEYRFADRDVTVFQNVTLGEERIGTIYILSDLGELDERFRHYAWIIGLTIAASLFLTYFISSRLQRVISEPIVNLAGTPEVPDFVLADSGRLRQIVTNLVGNAIKFTEEGEVVVRIRVESRSADSAELRFEIADTGIGIPKEKFDAIFAAFMQIDGSTSRKYGGTGLGLTISSQLVQLMKGRIVVESAVGRGSTFSFILPMAVPKEREVVNAVASSEDSLGVAGCHGLRILLAEDNAVNQRVAAGLLEKHGHQVTIAANGIEAVAAFQKGKFDLILMDIQMPHMGGFEATARIRELEKAPAAHGRIPIVALTAHAMRRRRTTLPGRRHGWLCEQADSGGETDRGR